jgi:hypothetical protein
MIIPRFKLSINREKVLTLAQKYLTESTRVKEDMLIGWRNRIQQRGYLTLEEFRKVCLWKTQRTKSRVEENPEGLVNEVTKIALSAMEEKVRIESLQMLKGVSFPTASCFLHLYHEDIYPILDFRALNSLGIKERKSYYDFDFWIAYTKYIRDKCKELKVDSRTMDRALWEKSRIDNGSKR